MGSAGAEAGDGVRQEGEGRWGGKQLLALPAHGHTALKSPVAGKGRGFVDYMPKYSNRRECLCFLAVWGEARSSSYLLWNRPDHQISVQNKVVKTWLSAWKESRIGLEDRGPVVLEN